MNRQWGGYHHSYHFVPPAFPKQFPFSTNPYYGTPEAPKSPYEYFQKPPLPYGPSQQQGFTPKGRGGNPLLQTFVNEKGQMDFDKMFSTVGQIVNTVHQVQPLVQQVGTIMKSFKQ